MKKILCLVLALVLTLVCASALGANPSPEKVPSGGEGTAVEPAPAPAPAAEPAAEEPAAESAGDNAVKTNGGNYNYVPYVAPAAPTLSISILQDTDASAAVIKTFADANEAGDVLGALPDDIKSALPADLTVINEIITAQINGATQDVTTAYEFNVKLDTLYAADAQVAVLVGKLGTTVDWTVVKEASVKADGSINFVLSADTIKSLGNNPFVLAVVSK
jgi:hypothetical protein